MPNTINIALKTLASVFSAAVVVASASSAYADYFVGQCGGPKVRALTLNAACKANAGKTIVKCTEKCVERKRLRCVRREWTITKSKSCGINNKSPKNSVKTRKCSKQQLNTLVADYKMAKRQAVRAKAGVDAELKKRHPRKTVRRLKRVQRWFKKIVRILDKKATFTCKPSRAGCKHAIAYTTPLVGHGMRACPSYFKCNARDFRASVIVHELAHKAGANDRAYFSHCSTGPDRSPPTNKDWSRIADSYLYWARFGFCVPGKTCRT